MSDLIEVERPLSPAAAIRMARKASARLSLIGTQQTPKKLRREAKNDPKRALGRLAFSGSVIYILGLYFADTYCIRKAGDTHQGIYVNGVANESLFPQIFGTD